MSGIGIDIVPILPKCPVAVVPAIYTGGMPRYVPYRTHPSLYAVQKVPFGLPTKKLGKLTKSGIPGWFLNKIGYLFPLATEDLAHNWHVADYDDCDAAAAALLTSRPTKIRRD